MNHKGPFVYSHTWEVVTLLFLISCPGVHVGEIGGGNQSFTKYLLVSAYTVF